MHGQDALRLRYEHRVAQSRVWGWNPLGAIVMHVLGLDIIIKYNFSGLDIV